MNIVIFELFVFTFSKLICTRKISRFEGNFSTRIHYIQRAFPVIKSLIFVTCCLLYMQRAFTCNYFEFGYNVEIIYCRGMNH